MRTLRNHLARQAAGTIMAGSLAVAAPASAEPVADWSALTIQFTAANQPNRPPGPYGTIDQAIVHIAMHDAVQAYQRRFNTYNAPIPGASGSMVAAVAKAAHDVLVSRLSIPTVNAVSGPLIAQVDAAYANYLIANGLAIDDPGVAIGAQAALNMILNRANDGSFPANAETFTGSTAPGQWRPTPPAFLPMGGPWLGDVTPFVLRTREGLLNEAGPPSLRSGLYTRDYEEVKAMGRRTNSARSPEQTTFALFFSGPNLGGVLRTVALERLTDSGDRARLFALAFASAADSLINTWNNKRTYNFWRPSTAILEAANDGNPSTEPDPAWLPLVNNPPYPDYTSGLNSLSGSIMRTLENFFGDDVWTFQATTFGLENGQPIAPRTYHRFSALADDAVEGRILLGIHFRFADEVARRQSKQTADQVFAHAFQPHD